MPFDLILHMLLQMSDYAPDDVIEATHANANEAVSKVFHLHNYQIKSVIMEECAISKDQIQEGISLSPLSNYDYKLVNSDLSASRTTAASESATATPTTIPTSSILMEVTEQFRLDDTEYRLWVELDHMIQLFQTAVGTKDPYTYPSHVKCSAYYHELHINYGQLPFN